MLDGVLVARRLYRSLTIKITSPSLCNFPDHPSPILRLETASPEALTYYFTTMSEPRNNSQCSLNNDMKVLVRLKDDPDGNHQHVSNPTSPPAQDTSAEHAQVAKYRKTISQAKFNIQQLIAKSGRLHAKQDKLTNEWTTTQSEVAELEELLRDRRAKMSEIDRDRNSLALESRYVTLQLNILLKELKKCDEQQVTVVQNPPHQGNQEVGSIGNNGSVPSPVAQALTALKPRLASNNCPVQLAIKPKQTLDQAPLSITSIPSLKITSGVSLPVPAEIIDEEEDEESLGEEDFLSDEDDEEQASEADHEQEQSNAPDQDDEEKMYEDEDDDVQHQNKNTSSLGHASVSASCSGSQVSSSSILGFPKICDLGGCTAVLNTRQAWHKHLLLHRAPRHKCPLCDQSFPRRDYLKRHLKVKHQILPAGSSMLPTSCSTSANFESDILPLSQNFQLDVHTQQALEQAIGEDPFNQESIQPSEHQYDQECHNPSISQAQPHPCPTHVVHPPTSSSSPISLKPLKIKKLKLSSISNNATH